MTFDTTRRGFLAGAAAGVAVLSLPIAVPTLARAEDGMQPSHPMSYLQYRI
ncbi:MAG TPA: twin-arginine translocation signal domain-containing protein [Kiloniellaceae bacterium]|nr:twin-arginine translocation signal domain-containing protein [Kiloniellaceae bacterium]